MTGTNSKSSMLYRSGGLSALLAALIIFSVSCTRNSGAGIIGIEVPIGSGRVSTDTPYIISGVYEDTPAFRAGLRPGDRIIQINDLPISNGMKFDEIYSGQLSGRPGTKVTIMVRRGSENMVFEIIRAERGD